MLRNGSWLSRVMVGDLLVGVSEGGRYSGVLAKHFTRGCRQILRRCVCL